VFRMAKVLVMGLGYLRRHKVSARPVSSSHLATLSQTSPSTSTITARCGERVIDAVTAVS